MVPMLDLADIFGHGGPLASSQPDFKVRWQQLRMAQRVATALEHRETLVAQGPHKRQNRRLKHRLPARQFNQRHSVPANPLGLGRRTKRRREPVDFLQRVRQGFLLTLRESVGRVAIRASQIARREPRKNAGQPRESALTLQAQINFINNQRISHFAQSNGGFPNSE